jgi:hypothetical protein
MKANQAEYILTPNFASQTLGFINIIKTLYALMQIYFTTQSKRDV